MVARSTNKEDTVYFLNLVIENLISTDEAPYLIYDRHFAHTSNAVQAVITAHFCCLKLPKASCQFNIQEKIWLAVKQRYREQLTLMSAQ